MHVAVISICATNKSKEREKQEKNREKDVIHIQLARTVWIMHI